jgi:type II secretory pathway component PulF
MTESQPKPPGAAARMLFVAAAAVPWLAIAIHFVVVVPRYKRLFEQFGMQLTTGVAWQIHLSTIILKRPLIGNAIAFAILGVYMMLAFFVASRPWSKLKHTISLIVLIALPLLFYVSIWMLLHANKTELDRGLLK